MSGPFRDELAAAHATIARLESEIASLHAKLSEPRPRVPWSNPKLAILCAITGIALVVAFGFGRLIIMQRYDGHAAGSRDPLFRGVAVTPHDPIPPTVDDGNLTRESSATRRVDERPNGSDKKPCNCTPGDPLCSCL